MDLSPESISDKPIGFPILIRGQISYQILSNLIQCQLDERKGNCSDAEMLKRDVAGADDPDPGSGVGQRKAQHCFSAQPAYEYWVVESLQDGRVLPRPADNPVEYLVDHICEHVRRLGILCGFGSIAYRFKSVDGNLLHFALREFVVLFKKYTSLLITSATDTTHP